MKQIELSKKFYLSVDINDGWSRIKYQENILYEDIVQEGLDVLKCMLLRAKKGELMLEDKLSKNGVGYWWNEYTDTFDEIEESRRDDIAEKYWLWSTRYIQSWLYVKGTNVCIEISPSYPWHFLEPEEPEEFITFEEFQINYSVIAYLTFDINTIDSVIEAIEILGNEI